MTIFPGVSPSNTAIFPEEYFLNVRCVWKHQDDDFTILRHIPWAGAFLGATREKLGGNRLMIEKAKSMRVL